MDKPRKPEELRTPGLAWRFRPRSATWVLYWVCPHPIAKRGYRVTTRRVWPPTNDESPTAPTPDEWLIIAEECQILQAEMLHWANGGAVEDARSRFDGTFGSLCHVYQTDRDSPYQELRFHTKKQYDSKLKTLMREVGAARLSALCFRDFKAWHTRFRGDDERLGRAHGLMTQVRLVMAFGKLLRLGNCAQLVDDLAGMTFEMPKKRETFITAAQAVLIRQKAHELGYPSIALAQAIQFELMLRQKDVIGEWLPVAEPGMSDVVVSTEKWLHGIRWSDIDANLILRKRISKSLRGRRAAVVAGAGKVEEFDLRSYPMIMEELYQVGHLLNQVGRVGPMIVCEYSGVPWRAKQFQHKWREIATALGLPMTVQNRDSRAGGITEATDAGANFEDVRRHASHSKPATTARYSRGHVGAKNKVAELRIKSRTP